MSSRTEIGLRIKLLNAKIDLLTTHKSNLEKSLQFIVTEKNYNERKIGDLENGLKPGALNKYGQLNQAFYFRPTKIPGKLLDSSSPEFLLDRKSVIIPTADHIINQEQIYPHLDTAKRLAIFYSRLEVIYRTELEPIDELYNSSIEQIKKAKVELVELEYPTKSKDGKITLRPPKRGELTKRCKEIAVRLKLVKFETMKEEEPKAVMDILINEYHIDTNLDTVKSTLRRADYCKSQS